MSELTNGSRPTVVVTRKLPEPLEKELAARYDAKFNRNDVPLSADALREAMRTADVVLCTVTDRLRAELFTGGLKAGLLANFGVGVNHIDLDAARSAGIAVTNTPDVLTDDTADLALGLLLMCMRRMGEGDRHVRTGAWSGWRPTHMLGKSARGKTLGIIGYGRIGRAVARRAHSALGMKILWHAPRTPRVDDEESAGPHDSVRVETLVELLEQSDVVSLHCPATPETRHLISADNLRHMKKTAFLINTARGDIVDEYALAEALREQRIAGAGLDVYEFEPSVVAELRDLSNVVLLPHLGSATMETRFAMGARAMANIDAFVAGQPLPDRVV